MTIASLSRLPPALPCSGSACRPDRLVGARIEGNRRRSLAPRIPILHPCPARLHSHVQSLQYLCRVRATVQVERLFPIENRLDPSTPPHGSRRENCEVQKG